MPNVNNQNSSDDLFKKSIEDAIYTLGQLEIKIDAVNKKTVNTKDKMTEAADGVDEFTSALAKLDNRQLKKLTTLSSNLKAVIQNLQGISNLGVAGDSVALLVDKVKGLSDLKLDFSQLDKLGDSIEKINNSLKDFLKLSKGLSAVDIEKLTNIGIDIKEQSAKKTTSTKTKKTQVVDKEFYQKRKDEVLGKISRGTEKRGDITNLIKAMDKLGEFDSLEDKLDAEKRQIQEFEARQKKRSQERKAINTSDRDAERTKKDNERKDNKAIESRDKLEILKARREVSGLTPGEQKDYIKLSVELGEVIGDTVEELELNREILAEELKKESDAREESIKEANKTGKEQEKQTENIKKLNEQLDKLKYNKQVKGYLTDQEVYKYMEIQKELGHYPKGDNTIGFTSDRKKLLNENREAKKIAQLKKEKEKEELSQLKKEIRELEQNEAKQEKEKEKLRELQSAIDAKTYDAIQAKSYSKTKWNTGGYFNGKKASELTDEELQSARLTQKEELDSLLAKSTDSTSINYDERIERLDKERKAKAEQRLVERELIAHRTEARLQKRLDDANKKLDYDQEHGKRNALARLANNTLGTNSPILQDLMEATGLLGKDFQSVQILKDKQAQLKAEYDLENKKIDNEEMSRKQQIRLAGLSGEQKNLLNNPNLTDAQKEAILSSADSNEEVINNLRDLDVELAEKRTKLNTEASEKLLENEEALNSASLKVAGTIAKVSIALKVFTIAVEGIWKASKKAAEANTNMVASLKSMGASSNEIDDSSIRFFTNELKNVEQRLKSIGRNFGEILGPVGAGWSMIMDWLLEGIEAITDKLAEIPKFFNKDISADSEKSINYSTKVLEGIATKLDKGIDVNGVEVKIDKEVAYRALSNSFGQSKTQGFDNASSANLSSLISNMATQVQASYGVDYTTASSQISDAIFNGSNSASAYGIVIDDQILAGYAALEKDLDLVNVQYTDAYKSALRYEMAEKMMADGNSKAMQDKIKQWKQLGDVMQAASGTLFDFQEVQSIEAKDFTIPEIGAKGGIVDDANSYSELNKQLVESGDMFVMTSKGMMTFQEALDFVNGDLSKFQLLMNKSTGEMVLATNDYLPSLTQAEQNLYDTINTGVPAIATYARHIGLTDEQMINLARNSGIAEEKIGALRTSLDELTSKGYIANFNYSSITEAKNEALALNEALANAGYLQGGEVDQTKPYSYASELSKYSTPIQEYVNNGYKFSDGSTVADMDGDGNSSGWDFGDYWAYLTNYDKRVTFDSFRNVGSGANEYGYGLDVPVETYGHAEGGLSFKEHTARISEGNAKEVILPLNSQETMSTLAGAISMSGILNAGSGVTVENININNDGINIADNNQAWRRVATRLADELSTLQRERGDLNYGIK